MKFLTDKIEWTPAMKDCANLAISLAFERLSESPENAVIKLTKAGANQIKVSASVDAFRAQVVNTDFYVAMHKVAAKLRSIIIKHHKKYDAMQLHQMSIYDVDEQTEANSSFDGAEEYVGRIKEFDLPPITLEEAIAEFEKTDYSFYVYRDIQKQGVVSIVYKGLNGKLGLIRCY